MGVVNLDLLSVGVAVAATGILGFVVFFNNRVSVTNRTFLSFALVTVLWGIVNYAQYNVSSPELAFWLVKTVIFFGVLQAFSLFQLFYVFPKEKVQFPKFYKFILSPIVVITAALTLTPLVFESIAEVSPTGQILRIENGPGIAVFGIVSVGLVLAALIALFSKVIKARGRDRRPALIILVGTLMMFALIITFNFVFPALRDNPQYIPLGAVFILPFVLFTTYALIKHQLLGVKVVATEILTFVLAVVTFSEIIFADEAGQRVFRVGVFLLVLGFGILLIKSVRQEVKQREQIAEQAKILTKQKKELEKLSNFKSGLLSLASHQLKAPMAVVKGYASILLEGLYGPIKGKVRETVEKMKDSTDELISLINTLLDLRRVDEGKMEYNFAEVNFSDLVGHVVDGLKPLAEKKKLELSFVKPDHEIKVNADGPKLSQVIGNLVENAIKYTPEGSVKVEIREEGEHVITSVKDSGLGISQSLLPHLFEEFTRDDRVKKEIRGTGLGLYIAKRMLEAHQGEIWAESVGEGKGSTFSVKLKKV